MSVESTRVWRKNHPEKLTAEARRTGRKSADEKYRQSAEYKAAIERYRLSGKKRLADVNGHLKHAYGKTLADKQAQYDKQNGICTLCQKPLPAVIRCHWDHNHVTGKMRDLLHRYCNQILGWIENDLHEKALAYIERHAND